MNCRRLAAAFAAALTVPICAFAAPHRADVALVLAIDVSGSVDDHRFKLQREGVAAALESEEVAAAILAEAFRRKLALEISGRVPSSQLAAASQ